MSGKTVAGVILIFAVVNLFALMWFLMLTDDLDAVFYIAALTINLFTVAFSASAFSEKKK